MTHTARTIRARQVVQLATIAIAALLAPSAQAQDPAPKPRLELADSAKRPIRNAPVANEARPNVPSPATAPSPIPAAAEYRSDFVRNQSVLGAFVYAPALATTLTREAPAWGAIYLLTVGGTYLGSMELSRRTQVTDPMQRLATGLPIRAAIAGAMFGSLAKTDRRATAATVLGFSAVGLTTALWRGQSLDDGEAAATLFGSDVAGLTAWGASTAMGLQDAGSANKARLTMTLGGMIVGAPLGQAYAALAGYNVTPGDLTAMTAASGVGMLAGLTVVANGGPEEREIAAAMTIGGLAGLIAGDRLLARRYDHNRDEGGLMIAGGFAGGLMGAGAALLTSGSQSRWTAYTGAMTTLGAGAGVAWSQYYLKPKADGTSRLGALRLNPIGVVAAASGMHGAYTLGTIRF